MGIMPKFVGCYCEEQLAPPYQFDNVQIWGFPVLAEHARVQGFVDQVLQEDRLEVIRGIDASPNAAGSTLVYVVVLNYGRMASLFQANLGIASQRECYVGIVMRNRNPDNIVLFSPYIFVDNPWSLVAGNTVIGYPKQLAWFQMGLDIDDPYPIRIDAMGCLQPFTPLQWLPFVQITNAPFAVIEQLATQPTSVFGDIEHLFGDLGVLPVEKDLLELLRGTAVSYEMRQLKQFRSAEHPDCSCYRSIVTGTVTINRNTFRPGCAFPPAAVQFGDYASSNIARDLGLQRISDIPFSLTCGFTLDNMKEELREPRVG